MVHMRVQGSGSAETGQTQTEPPPGAIKSSILLAATITVVLVLVVYVWIVSLGTWTSWPEAYDYSHYDKLATAFLHGQLDLEQAPSPALLALSNPYDPASRGTIPYLTDASLFRDKYYLYFGPVPALLLMLPKIVLPGVIHDIYLVFVFVCLLFLMETVFILEIHRRFLPRIPWWIVVLSILFLGLGTPLTWILGSQAAPHNAAIAAGQFFFLASLYTGLAALAGQQVHRSKALLAGIFWVGAFGSRLTQLVPVAFVAALFLVRLYSWKRGSTNLKARLWGTASFALPLILGAAALGWYNWARFGSVLETGLSYQLAMLPLQNYSHDLFSVRYVIQNLYNYILNSPRLRYAFPYVWPQIGWRTPVVPGLALSPIYFTEENTGLIYIAPLLIYAALPAFRFIGRIGGSDLTDAKGPRLCCLEAALAGSFLSGFAVFLAFFWASNRYVLDFAPPLMLLSVVGFWQTSEALRGQRGGRAAIVFLGIALIVVSLLVSALLTLAQNAGSYAALDPHISRELRRLFGP